MEALSQSDSHPRNAAPRVRVYLRCLGITDGAALDQLAEQAIAFARPTGGAEEAEQAAMEEILRRKETWFVALSEYACGERPQGRDPVVGWRLAMILREQPEALFRQPSRELADAAMKAWEPRCIPEARQGQMPPQPLEDLPAGLRKEFWRTFGRRLTRVWRKLPSRSRQE